MTLYNEFQKLMAEMRMTLDQKRLRSFKQVSGSALPRINKRVRAMLSRPKSGTKMAQFVADAQLRDENVLPELQRAWSPVRVFRNDPKNSRITYEIPEANMMLLADQMERVGEIVTDETQDAMTDDAEFMGNLIRDVVHGRTKVKWTGAE